MLKPGGILIIDHRNYDYILDTGKTPAKNIYYNVSTRRRYLADSPVQGAKSVKFPSTKLWATEHLF